MTQYLRIISILTFLLLSVTIQAAESFSDQVNNSFEQALTSFEKNDYRTAMIHQIGRAHVWTPVTSLSRMPSSAWKKKQKQKKQKREKKQQKKKKQKK